MTIEAIKPGLTGELEITVAEEHTVPHVGSGQVRVGVRLYAGVQGCLQAGL